MKRVPGGAASAFVLLRAKRAGFAKALGKALCEEGAAEVLCAVACFGSVRVVCKLQAAASSGAPWKPKCRRERGSASVRVRSTSWRWELVEQPIVEPSSSGILLGGARAAPGSLGRNWAPL